MLAARWWFPVTRTLLVLLAAGIAWGSLLPSDDVPGLLPDWLMHGLGYALLGFLALAAGIAWLPAILVTVAFGVLLEVAQGVVGYRSFELRDIVFDAVGACVGVFVGRRVLAPVWRGQTEAAQERKRQWRRERDKERAQRRVERAMSPQKAAAKRGAPTWQQVAKRQGAKCWLCGTRTYSDDRQRDASGREHLGRTFPCLDFVVAVETGGTYEDDNLRLAHRHCAAARRANPSLSKFGRPPRTYQ